MSDVTSTESAARMARVPRDVRHIHLIGVAGTAMAALAGMLAERGYRVTGSDNQLYEPTASLLARMRVEVQKGFGPQNLTPPPDLVVVGNVVPRANPEAQALLQSSLPYLSMPEALWHFFLGEKRVLMVAGTHGKTTSTAIMAHVLNAAGRDPSMLVGGVAKDFGSNYRLGAGGDFVIEGDEYDTAFFDKGPKFLHYRPQGAILTAVEFDHADIYRDLEHVKSSFSALAARMEPAGVLVVCADSPAALEVTERSRARRITFGLGAGEFRAAGVSVGADGARFSIEREGKALAEGLRLPIGGRMNVANALGVAVLLGEFGVGAEEIARGLGSFRGVVRRQELIGEARGVAVVDDFAHHPTAIRATLDGRRGALLRPAHPGRLRAALQHRAPQRLPGRVRRRLRSRRARLPGAGLFQGQRSNCGRRPPLSRRPRRGYRAPRAGRVRLHVDRRHPGADAGRGARGRRRARDV